MKYFQQTRESGYSHWGLWVFVFWITVLGWLAAQLFITSPIPSITEAIAPSLASEYERASFDVITSVDINQLRLLLATFVISSLCGLILSLLALNNPIGSRRNFAIGAGFFITMSFVSLFLVFPMGSSPELSRILNRILAISPFAYALVLLTFPVSLILLFVGQKHVLKRSILSLHTAATHFRKSRLLQSVFITWAILAIMAIILNFSGLKPLSLTFDASRFFIYAAISLCFIPLQSATEEIVFRGYLNQAFENILNNKWIAFVITSVMFMALHLSNPEALSGAESGILPIVMSSYFVFGFACCLMVWMDDGLESAIGVHAANNTFAAVFINYENSVLPTPSVFQIKTLPVLDILLTIVTLSLVLIVLWYSRPKPVSRQV